MTVLPLPATAPVSKLLLASHVLDLEAGTLVNAEGAPIAMRPQAWALLCALARRAGRIVSKSELLDAVWPGLVVTESSLEKAISDLRAAFGADGRAIIETASRRGYRLHASPVASTGGTAAPNTALPAARGLLFGRDGELAELQTMLAQHRLINVVGPGGVGKTAVAMAVARAHVSAATQPPSSASSAAWVDLAQLADPQLLVATVARALALPVAQGGEQLAGLLAALAPLTALLVLDNAEHLVAGVARLTRAMLDAAPGLRVLVTSQAPLRLEGEQLFRLAGLELPAPGEAMDQASRRGAVALLIDQARAADRHLELTAENAHLAIELCRRLDGLPLAIRLAAARLPLLGLAGVVARLDERLQLLATERRDTPARQQTLLAALDWSYGLLSPQERSLFCRLGLFVGGFSLDLAIALARCEGVAEWQLIEQLNVLVERNLVDVAHAASTRYRMLETQRDYASRQLHANADMERVRGNHARAVESVMRIASKEIWVSSDADWRARWAAELDNVRAALDWSAGNDAPLFASLVGSTGHMFRMLDLGYELRQRAQAVSLERLAAVSTELQMRYWMVRAYIEAGVSAQAAHEGACRMEAAAREIAHTPGLYIALCHRVASGLVAPAAMPAVLAEIESLESPAWPARHLAYRPLAEYVAHSLLGDWPRAQRAAEAGLALATRAGSELMLAVFANGILVALLQQHLVQAAITRSQALHQRVMAGPAESAIPFVGTCARCAQEAGDLQQARRLLAQLFGMCRMVDWAYFDFFANRYMLLAMTEGRSEAAARLLGYADAVAQRSWGTAYGVATREQARSALAPSLSLERLDSLLKEGAGLSRESVCAWTLQEGSEEPRPAA